MRVLRQTTKKRFCQAIRAGLFILLASSASLSLEGLQVGMKAPLFELKNLKGNQVRLADQRDAHVTVVVFWANWSDHSPTVLSRLNRLYRKHKRERMSVLAVNVERQQLSPMDLAEVGKTVKRLGLNFPVLLDDGLTVFREYGVVAVPSTVVLDAEGVIRAEMAAYPLAQREDLFELVDAMAEKRELSKREEKTGYQPIPRAIRYYNLARAMVARGMVDVVDANLKKSISTDPNFVLPVLFLAKLLRERAETREAIEYQGSETITATFDSEKALYLEEASDLIARATQLAPDSAPVLTESALILQSQGNQSLAKEKLTEAIEKEPTYTPAQFCMASLLVRNGQVDAGEKQFQRALHLNPLGYEGYYAMAQAYEERGIKKKAIEAYRKVYEILYQERELFPYSYGR